MPFEILDHLDKLKPDGGHNDPKGDHSFLCPACGATNFKVNITTGKWATFGCDCGNTESGKRKIRDALSPAAQPSSSVPAAKAHRPAGRRNWDYFTPDTLTANQPALTVHRTDDGQGNRRIWQQSLVNGLRPADLLQHALPYGLPEAKQALADGAPFAYWVEGEPCVDALRAIGLPAITSIGGAGKFKPDRDGPQATGLPADRIVVVPDQDKPGVKHAEAIAAAYPGCQWLLPFPETPQWNGAMPSDGGLDIADWIAQGATAEQIHQGVGPKPSREAEQPPSPQDFILLANNTLQRLKDGIAAINALPTPAARTVAQFSLRGELGLEKEAYKQAVQDLLEEQETPAPTSFEELMKLDAGVETSIEDLAAKGGLTLVAAEGHAGKTSLFYRMAEAISTGENFAGRFKTTQGAALIYQLDESPTDAIAKFRRMSLEPDPSRFIPKWKLSPSMIPELEQDIRSHQPVAVFADSLMRIFGGRGIGLNDAEFGIWLYQLNSIASRYGTSFFLSHHLKKPDNQKRTRVSKHDLFGTAFLFNGTSDCWGLYPSEQNGARSDEFSLEFLKSRSGIQEAGTVFNFQGSIEDFSWEFMGIQGQTESLEDKKHFADQVQSLLAHRGGQWTAQEVADHFTAQGRPISNERARTTLIKLFERRQGIDRRKRASAVGRPTWIYFSASPRA